MITPSAAGDKKKRKRMSAAQRDQMAYGVYIHRVLKQVHPGESLRPRAYDMAMAPFLLNDELQFGPLPRNQSLRTL